MVFLVTLYITTGLIQDEATDASATLVRGIESDLYGQVDGELSRAQRLVKLSDSDSIGIREAVESATHKAAASYAPQAADGLTRPSVLTPSVASVIESEIQKRLGKDASEKYAADLAARRRFWICLLYTSPSPRDRTRSRMPSSA